MIDIESRLRAAMHSAVDDAVPPRDLAATVIRRHRRHTGLAVGFTLLAVIVVFVPAVLAASHGPGRPAIGPGQTGSPSPSRSHAPSPFSHLPTRFRGPELALGGMQLFMTGSTPEWYAPATSQVGHIAGLPFSKNGYDMTRLSGGWAATPYPGGPACCAGRPVQIYYVADGSRVAKPIGTGYSASAAAAPGAVWLSNYQGRKTKVGTAAARVREFSGTGKAIGPIITLPKGYYIKRAVGPYLLLSKFDQGPLPATDLLWDPASGRPVRTFTGVIASGAAEIAWQPSIHCGTCAVHIVNVRSGQAATIALPANTWAYSGTFSADGHLLALAASTSRVAGGAAVLARLGVVDTSNARLTFLRGSSIRAATEDLLTFGWLEATQRLVAVLGREGTPVQIAAWQPGQPGLRVAPLTSPPGMWPTLGDAY
jgi:hypothetical protein